MALEKLTIKELYTMPHTQPEVHDIEIDFDVGEESLAGDEEFIMELKSQVDYMPKEPCQSAFLIEFPDVAKWTAQPFTNKDDFKVLLFTMHSCIDGDEKIEWVDSDAPYEHFTYEEGTFAEDLAEVRWAIAQEEQDSKLIAAQNPPPYNTKKP